MSGHKSSQNVLCKFAIEGAHLFYHLIGRKAFRALHLDSEMYDLDPNLTTMFPHDRVESSHQYSSAKRFGHIQYSVSRQSFNQPDEQTFCRKLRIAFGNVFTPVSENLTQQFDDAYSISLR